MRLSCAAASVAHLLRPLFDKSWGAKLSSRRNGAMLAMIDKGEADEAHPANWAPFVVVGEGAAAK